MVDTGRVRFSTVAMVLEAQETLEVFARYYVEGGCEDVILMYDGPLPEGMAIEIEGVRLIACDPAFWAARGEERPAGLVDRQNAVYAAAVELCRSEWVLIVDADEHVHPRHRIAEALFAVPDDVISVTLPTVEAAYAPGDDPRVPYSSTIFRMPVMRGWRFIRRLAYGRDREWLQYGVLAHRAGKQFLRRDAASGLRIGPHSSHRADGSGVSVAIRDVAPGAPLLWLCHYDAISLERWRHKWSVRLRNEHGKQGMRQLRRRQSEVVLKALDGDEATQMAVIRRFYGIGWFGILVLRALGCVIALRPFDEPPVSPGRSDATGGGKAETTRAA